MSKTKIGIIAGEDIDMPEDYIKANDIEIYNYSLTWEGVSDVRKSLYKKMRTATTLGLNTCPKTSQPSVGFFKELYMKSLKTHQDIIVLCISSKLSGTYNSAQQAKSLLNKEQSSHVHLLESYSSTSGSAFIVTEIIRCLDKKMTITEIKKHIPKFQEATYLVGMIEDCYWLHKGGRISSPTAMILNQMKKIGVRPLLGAKDGKISLFKIRLNAKNKTTALFNYVCSQIGDKNAEVIITYSDNLMEAKKLKKQFINAKSDINIRYMHEMTPVLGAHLGPDTIMIGWRFIN